MGDKFKHVFDFYGVDKVDNSGLVLNLLSETAKGAGHIYLIDCNEYTKIGYTQCDVSKRVAEMQIGNPYELTLWAAIKVDNVVYSEMALHSRLGKYMVRGEWFKLPQRIKDALKRIDLDNIKPFIEY